MTTTVKLLTGHVLDRLRELPDASVHCCVTSPPYFGLRSYDLPDQVWGGDPICQHEWSDPHLDHKKGTGGSEKQRSNVGANEYASSSSFCVHCNAWQGSLGLEPTPDLFIEHLVQVFREVRRVLRDDGTFWLNIGDSYAGHNPTTGFRPGNETKNQGASNKNGVGRVHGVKPKDLLMVPLLLALALRDDGWYLRSEIIWAKCLSGGAIVYAKTAKGEMPTTVKDMVRLDPKTVQLWDGEKWNQCLEWHSVNGDAERKTKASRLLRARYEGKPTIVEGDIEIELRSGERIGCTREHKWPTDRGLIPASELRIGDIIDSCLIPEPAEPRCPVALDDDMVGWFIGLYIAEGSQSDGTIQIASHRKEILRFDRLRELVAIFDGYMSIQPGSENGCSVNLNSPMLCGLIETYVSCKIAKDKHLSPRCWKRSNRFLRAVMDGYLSGDGGVYKLGRWRLGFCKNDALAADLRCLSARIGGTLRLRRNYSKLNDHTFPGWAGSFYFDPARRHYPDSQIVAIRQSRARRYWDIVLDSDPHLFSLASGILTHNSNPMPESVTDRPTCAHEKIFLFSKSPRYYYDQEAVKEKAVSDHGSGTGFRREHRLTLSTGSDKPWTDVGGKRNMRNVWQLNSEPYKGAHFATFPTEIPRRAILAGTSGKGVCAECGAPWERVVINKDQGSARDASEYAAGLGLESAARTRLRSGFKPATITEQTWQPTCTHQAPIIPATVLDPFGGSGTTANVASENYRSAISVDLNPKYVKMQDKRFKTNLLSDIELE